MESVSLAEAGTNAKKGAHAWELDAHDGQRTYYFRCADDDERRAWLAATARGGAAAAAAAAAVRRWRHGATRAALGALREYAEAARENNLAGSLPVHLAAQNKAPAEVVAQLVAAYPEVPSCHESL